MKIDVHFHLADIGELIGIGRAILHEVSIVRQNTERLISMSGSVDQRLADLTTLVEKERDDNAKFRADVTAALAALGTLQLNVAQQAAFDNVMSIVQGTDQATLDADAALPQAPPAP